MLRAGERIPVKARLYRHQADAFHFVMKLFGASSEDESEPAASSGAALLMEMGTGKTITSIAVAGAMHQAGKVRRVLIVAPLSILGVWEEEFAKFADFDYSLSLLTGNIRKKADTLRQMRGNILQIAVVNYESAWRMEKELLRWDANLVIADEGHKIKTHNISASKTMHKLGAKARYKLLLTGTVITNKAIDVFSQYKFIDPTVFGESFYSFRNRYFDMVGYPRALQTAAIISRETGIKLTVEMDLREWEPDKTFQFKSSEEADALYQNFCNCKGVYPNGEKRNWEEIDEIIDRVDPVIHFYYKQGYKEITVVAHGGIIRRFTGEANVQYCTPYIINYCGNFDYFKWVD